MKLQVFFNPESRLFVSSISISQVSRRIQSYLFAMLCSMVSGSLD